MRDRILIFLLIFVSSIAFFLIKPALALKVRSEHISTALEVTAITSSFMIARAIASSIAGIAGDKNPALRITIARYSLLPISFFVLSYIYAPNTALIIMLSGFHGFFSGLLWPTVQVIFGFSASERRRGAYMGLYFAVSGIGSSLGYFLYGILPLNNNEIILVGSILYFLSFFLAFYLFKSINLKIKKKKIKIGFRDFSTKTVWVLSVSFAVGGVFGLMNEYIYLFLYEVHGLTKMQLGFVLTVSAMLGIFSGILSGFLADRIGIEKVLVVLLVFSFVGLLAIALFKDWFVIAVALSFVTLSIRATLPLTRNIAVAKNSSVAGSVVGLSNTLSNVGSSLFPLIAGYIYDSFGSSHVAGIDGRATPLVIVAFLLFLLVLLFPR